MADPQSVNIGLSLPLRGSNIGVWDTPVNADFSAIDGMFGGVQTIAVSNAPVTLTVPAGFTATPSGGPTQAQNMALKFTGTLTTNVVVTLPMPGMMIIHNLTGTANASSLIFSAPGAGQSISTPPGSAQRIYNDGTNVYLVDLPMIGSFLDLYASSVPAWINACTVAPYLYCNGGTFNATTYPYLNSALGGNTLPDLRGRSRATFNDGTSRITTASGINGDVVGSAGGVPTLTITQTNLPNYNMPVGIIDPGHIHATQANPQNSGSNLGQNNLTPIGGGSGVTGMGVAVTNITTNGANLGGSSTPMTNMSPTIIAGITMIRAG